MIIQLSDEENREEVKTNMLGFEQTRRTQVQRTLFNYTAPHWLRHAETIHSVSRGSFRRHVLY